MSELLPCPFCGSNDLFFPEDKKWGWCMGCSAEVLISNWNNRARIKDHILLPSEPTEAMIEAGVTALIDEPSCNADDLVPAIYRAMIKEAKDNGNGV